MMMFALSVCGYWVIDRSKIARMPSTRMKRLMTTASTGRRMNRSVSFILRALMFLRRRIRIAAGLDRIVDCHRRSVLDLQLSGGDHNITFLHTRERLHLVTTRVPQGDERLFHRLAALVGGIRDDQEHGRAIRVIGDRRLRQRQRMHQCPGSHLQMPCLLYTSPSPRDRQKSRMPSSA